MTIRVYRFAPELDGTVDGKLFGSEFKLTLVSIDKICGKRKWATTKNQALKLIWDDTKYVADSVDKRLDHLVLQGISTGKISINVDNNPDG